MTANSIATKLRDISGTLSHYPAIGDQLIRKNQFLEFNEILIRMLHNKIDRDSILTLLYVHDLCKKGYFSSIQGMPSNASVCFSKIEQLISSLKHPDSDIVRIMCYPLLSTFLSGMGKMEMAYELTLRNIETFKMLELGNRTLPFHLYHINIEILYSRLLIKRGEASVAIQHLFDLLSEEIRGLQEGKEYAAAAAVGLLIELNKFALLNGEFNKIYRSFLNGLGGSGGGAVGPAGATSGADGVGAAGGSGMAIEGKEGDRYLAMLSSYLNATAIADASELGLLLDNFSQLLSLQPDENGIILTSYLFLDIRKLVGDGDREMDELTDVFSGFVKKFKLEKTMEKRILALLN